MGLAGYRRLLHVVQRFRFRWHGAATQPLLHALVVAGALIAAVPAISSADPGTSQGSLQFSPFQAPSAAGERALAIAAGQQPPATSAPTHAPLFQAAPSQPGIDVIANNPADDTPERTTQSETSLAVNGNTICAGYNNSGPGGTSGLSRSPDLGGTWTDLGGIGTNGDPSLAVHKATGTFYYAELGGSGTNPVGLFRSADDCRTFGPRVAVSSTITGTNLYDKPSIAVDNTGGARDGNIYACWTRFFSNMQASELRFSRSTNGGTSFTDEQVLAPNGTAPFGCAVTVGPNGEVYVSWADRAGTTANDIRFRRSTDGGLNFDPAVSVSTGNRPPGTDRVVSCGQNNNRPTLTGDIRMLHQAWMAVDTTGGQFNGNIYVAWVSDPVGTPDNSDVFFSRSTNGGTQWSTPTQLGAGGGATDQFEPFIAVGGTGVISFAWYDRRNDATNDRLIDVYKTFSRDGGVTLDPIARVTDQSFDVPPINPNFDPAITNCYMGEYIGAAGDAANFYYLWGDNRNILKTTNYPNGRPDPDVFFEREPVPQLNRAPDCSGVRPDVKLLWPPNHKLRQITLSGATDPDGDPLTLKITSVTQDEPLNGRGDGNTAPDAKFGPTSNQVLLRAERSGKGDGRVYRIAFEVSDGKGGNCAGSVNVGVPRNQGKGSAPIDSGQTVSSL